LTYLEDHMPSLDPRFFTVVHGDVNHNNWLLSDHDELFLVDWEGAMIADPAIDLGMLLYNYVPENKWPQWLNDYGTKDSIDLQKRMKWYTAVQSIGMVQWYEEQKRYKDMNMWLKFLNEVMNNNAFIEEVIKKMRMRYKPWAEDYLKSHPDIVDTDVSHAGHISEWFDKDQPIYIEIGSGMGQFITTLAAQRPEINFISMEREKNVMVKVLDKVREQNLTNIKLICNDAIELNEYFKDGEISRIYLNFSDPWPKRRHTKRRLTYHTFLSLYKQVLKTDGEIHFKTD